MEKSSLVLTSHKIHSMSSCQGEEGIYPRVTDWIYNAISWTFNPRSHPQMLCRIGGAQVEDWTIDDHKYRVVSLRPG